MKLITKAIEKALPPLYATEDVPLDEKIVHLKIFNPYGAGTWLIFEYNPETEIAFGLCDVGTPELGYVSLAELKSVKVPPFGLPLERDAHLGSVPLPEAISLTRTVSLVEWAASNLKTSVV
jgi:hypothetical protein